MLTYTLDMVFIKKQKQNKAFNVDTTQNINKIKFSKTYICKFVLQIKS